MEFKHTSVLLEETIDNLHIKPNGIYVDGTLGGGGHSYQIASRLTGAGRLIGIDQDGDAIEAAGKRLEPFADRITLIRNNYCNAREALKQIGIDKVDGIVLDLGVSSFQLDNVERGFSYKYDTALDMRMDTRLEPFADRITLIRNNYCNAREALKQIGIDKVDGIVLDLGVSSFQLDNVERGFSYKYDTALDMRMDTRQSLSAKEIVNEYSEMELFRVIKDYGEEQFAKNIAKHIVNARKDKPIETTGELNEIIKAAIPAKMRATGGHPSKKTFQAIRIECNRELEVLRDSLDDLIDMLNPEGRICIITFHSLEDRIVKSAFRKNENPCTCPPDFPVCVCGQVSKGRVVSRKPILPSEEETEANKRSKSAKLRVFERT